MTLPRLPPPRLIELCELHDAFRLEQRGGVPSEYLAHEVAHHRLPLPENKIGNPVHLPCIQPGTVDGLGYGWQVSEFMLLLPTVTDADINFQTCLSGRVGAFLLEQLIDLGYDLRGMRATYALRFPLPAGKTSYSQQHKVSNRAFARADCYACNPRAIITFGADAFRCLFGPDAKVDNYRGSVHDWEGIPVIPTVSHLTFAGSHGGLDVFRKELFRAREAVLHGYVPGAASASALPAGDWRVLDKVEMVEEFEAFLCAENANKLAIDTEFGNDTGREEDHYLLTMQIAWGAEKAAIIILRDENGKRRYSEEETTRIHQSIVRMMRRADVQLGGHHLRTDVDMPSREDICFDDKLEGGFDTMLASHLLHGGGGDESQGLDHLTRRHVEHYGCYWKELEEWLSSEPEFPMPVTHKKTGVTHIVGVKRGRKELLRFGYRDVPYSILIPYALKDASATWIAWQDLAVELAAAPVLQNLFTQVVMPCSLHLMDVQRQGIKQDRQRVQQLNAVYKPEYEAILAEFRELIRWPNFNPGSKDQKAFFLYGTTRYRDRDLFVEKHGAEVPKDAVLLGLKPLYNTDKYPREWSAIEAEQVEHLHFPSTKAATIDLLWNQHKDLLPIKLLKQLSVLGKFLSTYLMEAEINEFGVPEGGKNICNNIWKDGRARGSLHQTSETGRYRMSGANLQTNPKKQEDSALAVFVDRRFGGMSLEEYKFKTNDKPTSKCPPEQRIPKEDRLNIPTFKSSFVPEEGHVLIEVDFKTAELAVLAFCSGDEVLSEIIEQERDLHAETACKAFKLPLQEELDAALAEFKATGKAHRYKKWVQALKDGYSALRDASKTVTFGLMYGRGSYALSREISKTGRETTPEECQQIIDGFARAYPKAWAWIKANKESAVVNGFVATAFGRKRYFQGIQQMPEKEQQKAMREASNSPIQGTVADLLAVAGVNLHRFRYGTELGRKLAYRILLPIHDAFLIEVRAEFIAEMKQVIQLCMSTLCKIPGTDKSIGTKIEVFRHRWGEEDEH